MRTNGFERELSAREEITLRLNEMEAEDKVNIAELRDLFAGDDEGYFDYLLDKIDNSFGRL